MTTFYRGSTIPLEFAHDDFPKADWTARLIIKGVATASEFDATADPDEEKFTVTLTTIESKAIPVGIHQIAYRYENVGGEVSFVPGCEVSFLAAPNEAGDTRSQWEIDLEATDAAIRAKITGGAVEEYEIQTTVGQRSLKNMSLDDLRTHRRWVLGRVNQERRAAGKKPIGGNQWRRISSSLGNQSTVNRRRY